VGIEASSGHIADRLDHVSIATKEMAPMVPLLRDVLGLSLIHI